MGTIAGPGLGNNNDYWNPQTQKVQILAGPQSPAGYDYIGNPTPSVLGASTSTPSQSSGGGNASALISALLSKGYNPTDAQNAANGPNAANLSNEYLGAAKSGNDAQLASLNTQYDQNKASLLSQLGGLDTTKANSLNSLNTDLQGVQTTVGRQKEANQTNTDTQLSDAGNTAKQTQNKNRNVLRALGILNSSAAGDILSRPMNEFDKQRVAITTASQQRVNELDDFLNQKVSEHSNAVKSIEDQYTQLVGNINQDLRFNDRQRSDAINAANAALQQRMAEISQSMSQYQQQVELQKQNFLQGLAQQAAYTLPQAQLGNILSTAINGGAQGSQNVGIAQDDPRKRLLSGF